MMSFFLNRNTQPLLPMLSKIAFFVLVVAFGAVSFHGIANYWQWGHDGYNGAAFANAARNSLKHGIVGQAQYYFGHNPPPNHEIYTHHPLMLHFHLIASFVAFGIHEWSARLTPALYSVGNLILIVLIGRRLVSPVFGLLAGLFFALTPLNLIFAHMIDHEQGAIFWCLIAVWAYAAWVNTSKTKIALVSGFGISLACQFDWPGYYLAAFLALHALLMGCFQSLKGPFWNRYYNYVLGLTGLVIVNAGLFFGWIYRLKGTLAEMFGAYRFRSETPDHYIETLKTWSADLQGTLLLSGLALWLVMVAVRLVRGRASMKDFVPFVFLCIQVVHSTLFPRAGSIHSYWTYYLSPALAFAGADVCVSLWKWAAHQVPEFLGTLRTSKTPNPKLSPALLLAWKGTVFFGLAALILFQTSFALQKYRWGIKNGHAAYVGDYSDQYEESMWIQDAAARFNKNKTTYLLVSPTDRFRIELSYYLNTTHQVIPYVPFHVTSSPNQPVLLVDTALPHNRSALQKLMNTYRSSVWNQRFVAVELGVPGKQTFYQSQTQPRPWWWCWLVHKKHPPIQWIQAKA